MWAGLVCWHSSLPIVSLFLDFLSEVVRTTGVCSGLRTGTTFTAKFQCVFLPLMCAASEQVITCHHSRWRATQNVR